MSTPVKFALFGMFALAAGILTWLKYPFTDTVGDVYGCLLGAFLGLYLIFASILLNFVHIGAAKVTLGSDSAKRIATGALGFLLTSAFLSALN